MGDETGGFTVMLLIPSALRENGSLLHSGWKISVAARVCSFACVPHFF